MVGFDFLPLSSGSGHLAEAGAKRVKCDIAFSIAFEGGGLAQRVTAICLRARMDIGAVCAMFNGGADGRTETGFSH